MLILCVLWTFLREQLLFWDKLLIWIDPLTSPPTSPSSHLLQEEWWFLSCFTFLCPSTNPLQEEQFLAFTTKQASTLCQKIVCVCMYVWMCVVSVKKCELFEIKFLAQKHIPDCKWHKSKICQVSNLQNWLFTQKYTLCPEKVRKYQKTNYPAKSLSGLTF